jgi:tetratricopeptide (TPR) repeat protein
MSVPALEQLWPQAQAAYRDGDLGRAQDLCERVLAIDPLHSPARLMAANLATQAGRHRLAVEHARAATRRIGRQTMQHVAELGMKLIAVGEYQASAALARKVDPAVVNAPASIAELSQQLSLLEQHDDALRYLEAAMARGLAGDWVHYIHGNYLRFLGRMPEAAAAYERGIAANPDYALAHQALATLDPPGDRAARIARVRASLARVPVDFRDLPYLQYALFKELDALGDTDGAWEALAAGARGKRERISYDREGERALFGELAARTGEAFLRDARGDGAGLGDGSGRRDGSRRDEQPVPLFVLGMPRTGTTLLERILGGHPGVALCGELNDFRMQFKWASDHFCLGFLDHASLRLIDDVDYPALGRRYLDHVGWRTGGAAWFTDKNPGNFMMAGLILRALPRARIIHLRRNPMDSCFSNLKELFGGNAHPYSYAFGDLAGHFSDYRALMAHWHEIAPGRILDLDYESMVSDPDSAARAVMAYCGLDYDPEQLRVENRDAPVSTASSAQVRQPIHKRNVGGWTRYAGPLEPLRQLLGAEGFET